MFFAFGCRNYFTSKDSSIDIKSMRAYYKQYFNDPTDPIVLTASDTLFDMAIRCNDTVMAKIALGAKVDYYYYGQGENRTDSIIAGVNRLKQYARSVGNAELYYWAWAARLVNYYIIQGEYNIALLEAEKMLQEAKGEKKRGVLLNVITRWPMCIRLRFSKKISGVYA